MEQELLPLATFADQFLFVPTIINEAPQSYTRVVVCGMGGSAICVNLLKTLFPELPIVLHNTYGLPRHEEGTFYICNSYSGNTEEVLESYGRAHKEGYMVAAISRGGKLIQYGAKDGIPHILLPESHLEPRFSIGHQLIALLTLMNEERLIATLKSAAQHIDTEKLKKEGQTLAEAHAETFPVLYASTSLYPIAYLIKAAINEGAKLPSFVNILPEANHNELQSFVTGKGIAHTEFSFLFLSSTYDHTRISKRFTVMKELYTRHRLHVTTYLIDHTSVISVLEMILRGYFMATFIALKKNEDPYKTPLIAEFKEKMN